MFGAKPSTEAANDADLRVGVMVGERPRGGEAGVETPVDRRGVRMPV